MLKVLVPIDGSKTSERAIRHVIALYKDRDGVEIHLVNVQEKADAPELRRFRTLEEIREAQIEHGKGVLRGPAKSLQRAGMDCRTHVIVGDPAAEIVALAKRGRFQKIVMGTHGRGAVTGLLMGSIATKVLHLSNVPVTLVK